MYIYKYKRLDLVETEFRNDRWEGKEIMASIGFAYSPRQCSPPRAADRFTN